jgi:hypothetical protein
MVCLCVKFLPLLIKYYSGDKTKRMKCGTYELEDTCTYVYMVLMGKTEGRRPIGRSWRRCEVNVKLFLQEIG